MAEEAAGKEERLDGAWCSGLPGTDIFFPGAEVPDTADRWYGRFFKGPGGMLLFREIRRQQCRAVSLVCR